MWAPKARAKNLGILQGNSIWRHHFQIPGGVRPLLPTWRRPWSCVRQLHTSLLPLMAHHRCGCCVYRFVVSASQHAKRVASNRSRIAPQTTVDRRTWSARHGRSTVGEDIQPGTQSWRHHLWNTIRTSPRQLQRRLKENHWSVHAAGWPRFPPAPDYLEQPHIDESWVRGLRK